jgi:sialate O-acetylesterase
MRLPSGCVLAAMIMQLSTSAADSLSLPSFWGSSMVIPRGQPVVLWGIDAPGANVTVTYAGGTWHAAQSAGADGRFEVTLPAANATTTPQSVVVVSTSGAAITLSDVVVGDV